MKCTQEGLDHGSRASSEPHHSWAPGQEGLPSSSGADLPAPSLQALMQTNPDILKTIQVNDPQGGPDVQCCAQAATPLVIFIASSGADIFFSVVPTTDSKPSGCALSSSLISLILLHTSVYPPKPGSLLSRSCLHTQTVRHQIRAEPCRDILSAVSCCSWRGILVFNMHWSPLTPSEAFCSQLLLSFTTLTPHAMQQGLHRSEGAL